MVQLHKMQIVSFQMPEEEEELSVGFPATSALYQPMSQLLHVELMRKGTINTQLLISLHDLFCRAMEE